MQIISDVACKQLQNVAERQREWGKKEEEEKEEKWKEPVHYCPEVRGKKITYDGTMFYPFFCFNLFPVERNIFRKAYKFLT